MILRPYQEAAVQAVYDYLRSADGNPCVVAPTGCGKSVLIGQIVKDACQLWNGRVFMVTHVRELVAQNADKVRKLCPELEVGIHSAGLKRRDLHAPVICASIQSVYKRAFDFDPFDLILIDEAHLLSGNDDSMYGRFLGDARTMNPHVRLVGFTATPYRLDSGLIYGDGRIFDEVCFDIGVRELIRDGYLSPLRSKAGVTKVDTSQLHVRGGEFVAGEVESLMDEEAIVTTACQEVVEQTSDRRSVLIFASGVRHGRHIASILKAEHGVECGFVSGETPLEERDRILSRFKSGELKYLSNCAVLTTGFDAPNIDCIALMRPTMSPGLYCLDSATEILSKDGWKRMGEIDAGDLVAAFDHETETIHYVPAKATLERDVYDNEWFISLETPSTSLRVTDQHQMVFATKREQPWRFDSAMSIFNRMDGVVLPKAGYIQTPGVPLTDDELRFIGWVMAAGNINKSGTIRLTQPIHQPWIGEIQRVIDACRFKHRIRLIPKSGNSRTETVWTIGKGKTPVEGNRLRGWCELQPWLSEDFSTQLAEQIDTRQFEVLLEAIYMGCRARFTNVAYEPRVFHIVTANGTFAERLQICAVLRGFRCSVDHDESRTDEFYTIRLKRGTSAHVASRLKSKPAWELERPGKERVWCVENELNTLVTRRNGKVTIVGNCQMVGRGFRLHPGKSDCLVLDYGGNVERHGPVDQVRIREVKNSRDGGTPPGKECPECHLLIAAAFSICPECGYEFPVPDRKGHEAKASSAGVLSGQITDTEYDVGDVQYSVHTKFGADEDAPKSMRVDYRIFLDRWTSEWVCFEHRGYARSKAEAWWHRRSPDPVPDTAERAVDLAEAGALCQTNKITVRNIAGERFDRIIDYELGPIPEPVEYPGPSDIDDDEIPF